MIKKVFTVYDGKAQAHLQPFFMNTIGLAVRAFATAASDAAHDFAKYPGDYTLFEVGSYDDETAYFENLEVHTNLGTATEHIWKEEQTRE